MRPLVTTICIALTVLFVAGCDNGQNPDSDPLITVENIILEEGDAGGKVVFTAVLRSVSDESVSVEYRTEDNTAIAGEDYEETTGILTISAGEMEGTIEVPLINDDIREADEKFNLILENPLNALVPVNPAVGTILNDDFTFNFGGYESPLTYTGYTLTWQDEFDGSELDANTWTHETGTGNDGWGNFELQYYRPENTAVEGGNLVITAKEESFNGSEYTSSRIVTQGKESFQYGRIDIRAVLPKGQGLWPALWMLGSNFSSVGWPNCGEIDIMEMVGGAGRENEVHGTVHWDNAGSYASFGGSTTKANGTFSDEYHVYSIIWDEGVIRWLVDDVQYHVIDTSPANLSEFRQDFFFIFNVAVGGNWPGSPDGTTTFPQEMIVDYVRVFDKN